MKRADVVLQGPGGRPDDGRWLLGADDGFAVAKALVAEKDGPAVVLTSGRDPGGFARLIDGSAARGFIAKERLSPAALGELLRRASRSRAVPFTIGLVLASLPAAVLAQLVLSFPEGRLRSTAERVVVAARRLAGKPLPRQRRCAVAWRDVWRWRISDGRRSWNLAQLVADGADIRGHGANAADRTGITFAVALLLPAGWLPGLGVALAFGMIVGVIVHRRHEDPAGTVLCELSDRELFAVLDRVCAMADTPRPEAVLRAEEPPNSWVVHRARRPPHLYLTTGLRGLLSLGELQAVLAHELIHIANRDAMVMSVVGMPGSIMLRARGGGFDGLLVVIIGALCQVGTAMLSRYREFAADAGSAEVTGRPSALASALLKVSDSLDQIPTDDLRKAAALNAFNLVPVSRPRRWWRPQIPILARVFATHPRLQARLDALGRLERLAHAPRR